ncbi:MAG: PAS domain S-box protein [Candidatus Omnitrophica bacterium]|nr:PAS domain S-box protein [Candidatus Omnitrophota bacterium]
MEKNSVSNYKTIFNFIPSILLILDENKNVIEVNKKIETLGYEIEEIVGKNLYELPFFISGEKLKEIFEGKTPVVEVLTKIGEKREMSIELIEIKEEKNLYYAIILSDFTFIKKLKENETLLNEWLKLAEKSVSGIYIYDEDFNILYANPAFCEIWGYSKDEILKKKVYELVYKEDVPLLLEMARKRFSGEIEIVSFYLRAIDKYGKMKYGKVIGRVTNYLGKKVIMGSVLDITDRVEYEKKLKEEHELISKILNGTIYAFSEIIEVKDPYTAGHQLKVSKLAERISKELGYEEEKVREIVWASLLHDIGKISIPSEILVLPRKLTPLEFEIVKKHPIIGYNVLKKIPNFETIAKIVLQHHERNDGSGYPDGLKEKNILKEAKILSVADVIEAMVSHRPYRPALRIEDALEEIYKNRKIKFDEEIVEICINLFEKRKFEF